MAKDKKADEKKNETPKTKTLPITLTEDGFDFHGSNLSVMDAVRLVGKSVAKLVRVMDLPEAERILVSAFQAERAVILEEESKKRNPVTP